MMVLFHYNYQRRLLPALTMLFAQAAFGQGIIYVVAQPQPYYSLGYPGTFDSGVDIDGDGNDDFILRSNDPGSGVNNAVLIPQGNNSIATDGSYVADMNVGDTVGSSLSPVYQWSTAKTPISTLAGLLDPVIAETGNFVGQSSGYIGFDLVNNGNNYYGWMCVSCPTGDAALYGTITEWAYESDPNTPITITGVPEPGEWDLLAIGGAICATRRTLARR